jgi:hypothetical protein
MKNPDQERADEFIRRLAGGGASDVVVDALTGKSPRRESEEAQGGSRLVDKTGKTRSPQEGGHGRSRKD